MSKTSKISCLVSSVAVAVRTTNFVGISDLSSPSFMKHSRNAARLLLEDFPLNNNTCIGYN